MRKDAIFRIASMSKPITGVAILMLMEEGKLRLTDPVSRFIPEFKNTQVAIVKTPARPATATQPRARGGDLHGARRPRHHDPRPDDAHVGAGERRRGLARRRAAGAAQHRRSNLATYVPTLGHAPLDFQPGTRWSYSALAGIDTLGRIVEVASGLTFDQFLKQRCSIRSR